MTSDSYKDRYACQFLGGNGEYTLLLLSYMKKVFSFLGFFFFYGQLGDYDDLTWYGLCFLRSRLCRVAVPLRKVAIVFELRGDVLDTNSRFKEFFHGQHGEEMFD